MSLALSELCIYMQLELLLRFSGVHLPAAMASITGPEVEMAIMVKLMMLLVLMLMVMRIKTRGCRMRAFCEQVFLYIEGKCTVDAPKSSRLNRSIR